VEIFFPSFPFPGSCYFQVYSKKLVFQGPAAFSRTLQHTGGAQRETKQTALSDIKMAQNGEKSAKQKKAINFEGGRWQRNES
jgi:hypothetical protein